MDWNKLINNGRLRESTRNPDTRNDLESDFGRVIFSPAIRRMHDKTQVFPLTSDDNIHSRLTHSMEVMSIGHSLGIAVCEDEEFLKRIGREYNQVIREIPIILKNVCLVHDIGNPPFGHFGETVIQNYFSRYFLSGNAVRLTSLEEEDFTFFDGNAQGFRVLTKLQKLNDIYGLNLTFSTLGAYLKYPNCKEKVKGNISKKKRGVFQSEEPYLQKIAEECGLVRGGTMLRHPLCYLMEAADSICYFVMDIEDGFNMGWYDYTFIKDKLFHIHGLKEKFEELDRTVLKNGVEVTKVVKLRIYLIQRLVDKAIKNFKENIEKIESGQYQMELIFDDEHKLAKELQKFSWDHIFPRREVTSLELTGHSVLTGLLNYYVDFIFHQNEDYRKRAVSQISNSIIKVALLESGLEESDSFDKLSNYYRFRVIVDFISGMTDQFALNHYQKLSGQKIN